MLNSMKEQTFGAEYEMILSRQVAAHTLARYFGTTPVYVGGTYRAWHVKDQLGRTWKVMRDSSINADFEEQCEVVTPVCHWDGDLLDDISVIKDVLDWLHGEGADVDDSCGNHVHVGFEPHTPQTIRNLVNLVASKEVLIANALDIDDARLRTYCNYVDTDFLGKLNKEKPTSFEDMAKLWYADYVLDENDWKDEAQRHYSRSRYRMLNLHSIWNKGQTVEFRCFNGTLNPDEAEAYIKFSLAVSFQALTSKNCRYISPWTYDCGWAESIDVPNPAYTFRCWLLRMGMIGDEFKVARKVLLSKLDGNAAWRHGDPTNRR